MTAARVSRAPARGTVFCLYPLASPSGPLYIESVFLLRSCINQLIHYLHLYRSLYSNSNDRTDASTCPTWTLVSETTRIPCMLSSEEECFIVRSLSSLTGKCLILGGERYNRILRLANKTSVIDPRVSDTSPSDICLAF